MHCESKVRYFYWEFDWFFFIPESDRKYSDTNSHNFAMTLISQDGHFTAGAGAVCGLPTCVPNSQSLDLSRWHLTIATHLLDYDIRRCGNVALFFANPKKDDNQIKMPYPYPSPVTLYSSPFHPWNKPDGEINIRLSLLWLNVVLWSKTKYKWRVR